MRRYKAIVEYPDADIRFRLARRHAEREALLHRAQQTLGTDDRFAAAWLFGSLGRGDGDALSDIDLFTVARDEHIAAFAANRQGWAHQIGTPLFTVENPVNAPPGGAYLMAWYPGADGPHAVDWYVQAQARALIPAQTRLLFDRVGLPRSSDPPRFGYGAEPTRSAVESATADLLSTWAMLLITAKYVARNPAETRMGLLQWTIPTLRSLEGFVGAEVSLAYDALPDHLGPAEKLALLRALAARTESLMPAAAANGVPVPAGIAAAARRYLDFVEAIIVSGEGLGGEA